MASKKNVKRGTVVKGKTKKVYQPTQCRLDLYLNQLERQLGNNEFKDGIIYYQRKNINFAG